MSTNMKAAFTLTLEDKLSGGLSNIAKALGDLRDKGNHLSLGGLERGGDVLRTMTQEVQRLTSSLHTVEATADRAWSALKRMGSAAFGTQSRLGQVGGKVGALGAAAAGYSIYGPLESAAELSNTLRHTAITAHQYGADADRMMAQQRSLYTSTALDTAQSSHKIAEAGFWMALTGMSTALVNKLSPLSAKIATAYNTEVQDAAKTAYGLNYSMKIGADDMERALGMLALLGKHGHFLFADQAKEMPGIAAAALNSHMTGLGSLEQIGAAMQISMKVVDPAQPAMAATNLEAFLSAIQQTRDDKTFDKYGADLPAILMDAAKHGVSPLEATLAEVQKIQDREAKRHHITDPNMRAQSDTAILAHLFVRKEAATFASAMLHNMREYEELKLLGHNTTTGMIDKDFHEAMRDLNSQMGLFHEMTTQLVDRLGFGFEPVLHKINTGLLGFLHGLEWLDKKIPGLSDGVLAAAGGMLALTAALGAIGFVGPMVVAGFELIAAAAAALLTPLGLVALGISAVAVAIYDWDALRPYVQAVGDAIGRFCISALDATRNFVVNGWQAMSNAITNSQGIQSALDGLGTSWNALKDAAAGAFAALDKPLGGTLQAGLDAMAAALDEIVKDFKWLADNAPATGGFDGGANNQSSPGTGAIFPGAAASRPDTVIHINAAPGTQVTVPQMSPWVTVHGPNPGNTTRRP